MGILGIVVAILSFAGYFGLATGAIAELSERQPSESPGKLFCLSLEAVASTLLSFLLVSAAILLLRRWRYATSALRIYAITQVVVSVLLAISFLTTGFYEPDIGAVMYDRDAGAILGIAGCIYPVAILIVLRRKFDVGR